MATDKMEFHQLYDGNTWIQPDKEQFTHCCCDCGSCHNIRLEIINADEIQVSLVKNANATKLSRQYQSHGHLVSNDFWMLVHEINNSEANPKKKLKALQRLLKTEQEFQDKAQRGDFLDS